LSSVTDNTGNGGQRHEEVERGLDESIVEVPCAVDLAGSDSLEVFEVHVLEEHILRRC
jgi:hypothetical protein